MDQPVVLVCCTPDAPGLVAFRRLLKRTMKERGLVPFWKEHYQAEEASLSIDGKAVWKGVHADFSTLRQEQLRQLFRQPARRYFSWKRIARTHVSFLLAVLVAFFPKCPFCWAVYMSLFSSWGLGRIAYQPWLLPVFIVLLFVNFISLYFSRKRHGYYPLILSVAGALVISINRIYFEQVTLLYIGGGLMIVASLWNSLSRRMARSLVGYFRPSAVVTM